MTRKALRADELSDEQLEAITNAVHPDDGKEDLTLDIDDETFMLLARAAHERDITLNQFVEQVLRALIDEQSSIIPAPGEPAGNDGAQGEPQT